MRKILIILGILLIAAAAGLVLLSYSPLRDITTAPTANTTSAQALPGAVSVVSLPISITYADLEQFANQKIPQVLVDKREKKRYKKRILGISFKIKGRLDTHVSRSGPVKVSAHEQWLDVLVPLKFKARFKGDDATDPDASSKGAANIRLRMQLAVTPQWQPQLNIEPSFKWTRKPKLKVGVLKLDASDMLGDALKKRLHKLADELEKDLQSSTKLHTAAAERWYELHQVRQLGDGDTPAWLSVDPQAAYLSPMQLEADALHLVFALQAKLTTLVGGVQPPPEAEPLPDLNIAAPPNDGFRLQLPVLLNYAGMTQVLEQRYLGKTLALSQGEIEFLSFKLYSSDNKLVLGAKIKTHTSGRLLNSQGWLYLQGQPIYDPTLQQLQIRDFAFTRQIDNPLISSASWVLQDTLRDQLAAALSYDLSEQITEAKASMQKRINRPIDDGFVMSGNVTALNLDQIQPRANDLLIVLSTEGNIAISSQLSLPEVKVDAATSKPPPTDASNAP